LNSLVCTAVKIDGAGISLSITIGTPGASSPREASRASSDERVSFLASGWQKEGDAGGDYEGPGAHARAEDLAASGAGMPQRLREGVCGAGSYSVDPAASAEGACRPPSKYSMKITLKARKRSGPLVGVTSRRLSSSPTRERLLPGLETAHF